MPKTESIAPPDFRAHSTYLQDHWSVVDVEKVDKVFATRSSSRTAEDPDQVRVDLDGAFAASAARDVGEEGEPVNLSIWLDLEDAKTLVLQVVGALPTLVSE